MAELRDAARTEAGDVREVIETERTDLEINAFINAASIQVDAVAEAEPDATEERLSAVETWLTAHLLTTRNELVDSEKHDTYSADYLRETTYGETALALDPSNVLSDDSAVIEFRAPDAKGTRNGGD